MLKKILISLLALLSALLLPPFLTGKESSSAPEFKWLGDFEEASKLALEEKKPLFVYFSGSDWCRWCKKIKSEALDSKEFKNYLGNFFLFVNIDFPRDIELPTEQRKQNALLKNRFKVKSFPTIVILDHHEKELDRFGYLSGGPEVYREKIFQILKDYEVYKESIEQMNKGFEARLNLEKLYMQAKQLENEEDAAKILQLGLKKGDLFFLSEKYALLAQENKRKTEKALRLKRKILDRDPEDKCHWHYRLAVIDFQSNLRFVNDHFDVMQQLKPLTDYLSRFGHRQNKNAWKVQMTVAQTLNEYNRPKEALSYAKQALRFAPQTRKHEVEHALRHIEALIAGHDPAIELPQESFR